MEVVSLQVFVSLLLALGSAIAFACSVHRRDYDHLDRLALFPIEPDDPPESPRES